MTNDELFAFAGFLMTKGKMPELTFGEVIDLVHAFRREHGYHVPTDDTQPTRDTQKAFNRLFNDFKADVLKIFNDRIGDSK